jgi:hypothetical protein
MVAPVELVEKEVMVELEDLLEMAAQVLLG